MPCKLIIAGGRDLKNWNVLYKEVKKYISEIGEPDEIVSGKCPTGADFFGEQFANSNKIPVKPFYPDWTKYGKAAGPIRNSEMVKYADALIAFWDEKSTGTADIIKKAKGAGLNVKVITYTP